MILEPLLEGGCLIVGEGGQQSHALDTDAAAIWACMERGVTATDAIVAETGLDADTVTAALARFVEAGSPHPGPLLRRRLADRDRADSKSLFIVTCRHRRGGRRRTP